MLQTPKTIVHICLAHFQKRVKERAKTEYQRGVDFILYVTGLLTSTETLHEAPEILFDLCGILLSELQSSSLLTKCFCRLQGKINRKKNMFEMDAKMHTNTGQNGETDL